jgi:glycosyltransferase involved in cell wall biosynthesis
LSAKLTVLIPCKNERQNIRDCIESARAMADEILVADSGSTDDTVEIARRLGACRVIEREFVGYADFKNWAIPQASHPWVLIVDADERVTKELALEIRRILAATPDDVDAYWIYRRNFYLGHEIKYSDLGSDDQCRLIRRDRCRYHDCRVHEGFAIPRNRTRYLRGKLLHDVYPSLDEYFRKRIHYTKLSAQDAWDTGKRTNLFQLLIRPFLRFFFLYVVRLGFLDGLVGIQVCMLTAFVNTFVRQARMWEIEHARPRDEAAPASEPAADMVRIEDYAGAAAPVRWAA